MHVVANHELVLAECLEALPSIEFNCFGVIFPHTEPNSVCPNGLCFFKRVIDEFDTIERGDPAYFSRQFLKSQGVDRVAARQLLDAMEDLDLSLLANVTMRTLVVCGVDDQDNGSATDLAGILPNAVYHEVPGAHLDSATKPELGEAIVEFLDQS